MCVKDIHSVEFSKTYLISSNNVPLLFFFLCFFQVLSICISKYLLGIGEAKICSVALEERLGSGHLERKKLSLMLSYFNRYARETIFFFSSGSII